MAAQPHDKILFRRYLDNQCSPAELEFLFSLFGTAKESELREMISEALLAEDQSAIPGADYKKKTTTDLPGDQPGN